MTFSSPWDPTAMLIPPATTVERRGTLCQIVLTGKTVNPTAINQWHREMQQEVLKKSTHRS